MKGNVRPFVHLRVHSTYSLGIGLSTPADICAHAKRVGYSSVALTDINGTYGYVEFHHAARSLDIKPIYGAVVVVDWPTGEDGDDFHALTLLALDRGGLRNVCLAASVSAAEREKGGAFQVGELEGLSDGVVAIAGLPSGISGGLPPSTAEMLGELKPAFGDRLFVEHLTHAQPAQHQARRELLEAASRLGIPPVMCQDVRFVGPEKQQMIDLIGSGSDTGFEHNVHSAEPNDADPATHGLMSPGEVSRYYEHAPEAYGNASLVASLVQPDILDALGTSDRNKMSLPMLADRGRIHDVFTERVERAFEIEFKGEEGDSLRMWRGRLKQELDIIQGTELEGTFLQFQEVVARVEGASGVVGPATGLRLQSLCAYLLGITTFNPYVVDERFRPFFDERERMNHILELQIPPDARPRAVESLHEFFDEADIGYVPSVEHITATRAIRMVAKRLDVDQADYQDILDVTTRHPGASLQDLCTQNRQLGALYRRSRLARELISHAASIEGLPYGFVRAKRTLIISPTPLREFLGQGVNPKTSDKFVQSTRDSFPIGSITRVDMSTLNALAVCARVEKDETSRRAWTVRGSDNRLFAPVASGETDGVFLLETPLIQRLGREFGIAGFDDLVRFLALMRYRRGGMSLAERVSTWKSGKRPPPESVEGIETALEYTNGWVLFDDQLRDVVSVITGLDPLMSAQMVRRFARQEPGELAALRQEYMMFASERGTALDLANRWFTRILHNAGSTVSRQHVIAEALIVVKMLHLKQTKRVAFLCARANVHARNDARRRSYIGMLEEEGRLLPPDANASGAEFKVVKGRIRAPLWAVDGVGPEDGARIAMARGRRRFRGVEDFTSLIDELGITYKVVEALAGAGALESIGLAAGGRMPPRRKRAEVPARSAPPPKGQLALGLETAEPETQPPDDTHPSPRAHVVSDDEVEGNNDELFHVLHSVAEVYTHPSATPVELAGRIRDLQEFKSGSGNPIGFFVLYDSNASVRIFVPWERVGRHGEPLVDGGHVLIRGTTKIRDGRKVVEASEVVAVEGVVTDGETTPDESADGDT